MMPRSGKMQRLIRLADEARTMGMYVEITGDGFRVLVPESGVTWDHFGDPGRGQVGKSWGSAKRCCAAWVAVTETRGVHVGGPGHSGPGGKYQLSILGIALCRGDILAQQLAKVELAVGS